MQPELDSTGYMDPPPARVALEKLGEDDSKDLQAVNGGKVNVIAGSR